jgi:hypothetical protein
MLCEIRVEEGGLADSKWMIVYAESPRMMTLDSFFLLINKKITIYAAMAC